MSGASILVAPGVRMAHVPGFAFGFPQGNNVYLLGDRDPVLVDTGMPGEVGEKVLSDLFAEVGIAGPRRLLATHLHRDHVGAWPWLHERFGTELWVHPLESENAFASVDASEADAALADGQVIDCDGVEVRVVFTPGHSPGHVVLELPSSRLLLTGDLIVGSGTSWVGPPGGSLVDYLASLRRVRTLDVARILPAHGPIVDDPVAKVDEYLEHRALREEQVLGCIHDGQDTVPAMVAVIYAAYPDGVHGIAALTMQGHLDKLIAEGRVAVDASGDENRYRVIG
ncbi:MAG: MBL fold metallo-hydrolase [Deltaproteobacteria bacterium]|nr:MBL fold metallo-hydrolase [Deltaproteobacteria bacterium]